MQMNSLMLVLVCLPLVAQPLASPVALSESKDVVPAFSSSGAITLPAVHLQIELNYRLGKKERRDLSVVYDPQYGHYLWQLAAFSAPADKGGFSDAMKFNKKVIYTDADGIYDFVFRSDLWVKLYRLRADSLDTAERATVNEIQQGLASLERGYQPRTGPALPPWPWDYKPIDLGNAIKSEFSCLPMRSNCTDELNMIVSVGKQGSNWRLVLRNRWDVEVIIDQNFNLVSVKQLTQPK